MLFTVVEPVTATPRSSNTARAPTSKPLCRTENSVSIIELKEGVETKDKALSSVGML